MDWCTVGAENPGRYIKMWPRTCMHVHVVEVRLYVQNVCVKP